MYLTKQRGYGRGSNYYELWEEPPTKAINHFVSNGHHVDWYGEGQIAEFCDSLLERHTNVHLKPGEIRKVKSITFEFEGINHA